MSASIWVGYPRSYTKGRARPIQYVTLHYTAGSEGPSSAENGAAYDKKRTDGTSCHYFTDSAGKALQEVPDGDRSHSARWHGNEIGIHIEICGTRQTRAQWLDDTSLATLKTTAALVAELCARHKLAVKRLSVAQTRAAYYATPSKRPTGINDHAACTLAYPEDQGDHMDVGEAFPWDVFMDLVKQAGGDMAERIIAEFGDTGEGIAELQDDLTRIGYTCARNKAYDAAMAAVVRKYRGDHGAATVGDGKKITGWMRSWMNWDLAVKAAKEYAAPLTEGTVLELNAHNATVTAVTPPV